VTKPNLRWRSVGRVVRTFADGVAVKFVERQNRYDVDWLVIRPLRSQNRGTQLSGWEHDEAEPAQAPV
jgi:hypothetical protein